MQDQQIPTSAGMVFGCTPAVSGLRDVPLGCFDVSEGIMRGVGAARCLLLQPDRLNWKREKLRRRLATGLW